MPLNPEYEIGWMTWEQIKPYTEQLAALELTLMVKYHYPDRAIPMSYCESRVAMLEQHLASGNTFFWGVRHEGKLIGYYWAYTAPFIDQKRWVLRSLYITEEHKGEGLGTLAIQEGLKKAVETGCDEAVTEYVPWNEAAAASYKKAGYEITRIEVVKKLK
jgi:GNAT superfamily N-acetyltransferase